MPVQSTSCLLLGKQFFEWLLKVQSTHLMTHIMKRITEQMSHQISFPNLIRPEVLHERGQIGHLLFPTKPTLPTIRDLDEETPSLAVHMVLKVNYIWCVYQIKVKIDLIDFTLYIDKSQGRIRERTIVMRTAASKKLNTYTSVLWISSRTFTTIFSILNPVIL